MSDQTRTRPRRTEPPLLVDDPHPRPALALVWAHDDATRVGEVLLAPRRGEGVFGRGTGDVDKGKTRVFLARVRPHCTASAPPLASPSVSRSALRVREQDGRLTITRDGGTVLRVNRALVESATLSPGDRVDIEGELSFLCVERVIAASQHDEVPFAFGAPDPFGIVGESPAAWRLRDELTFYAARDGHVLLTGPSGAGKELAAKAVHGLSTRRHKPLVSRNAATLPPGIVDAELFGNARNFPNPGMRERGGLIGEADGGTLFLDEIGELPESIQAHLLRVLDAGEFHRLGEDRARKADLRVLAATQRDEDTLKPDLLARFKLRVVVPGLAERREDIPLLARAQLARLLATDAALAKQFGARGEARLAPDLADALSSHAYTTHARELEALLLASMATSRGDTLQLTPKVESRIVVPAAVVAPPSRDEIVAALSRAGGNVSKAYKDLGLSSRDALNRLIRKLAIDVERSG